MFSNVVASLQGLGLRCAFGPQIHNFNKNGNSVPPQIERRGLKFFGLDLPEDAFLQQI
jgi:hypothetical protein